MSIGPNVRRLWAMKMAKDAIPIGGGFEDGIRFLSNKELVADGARRASDWVKAALKAVREAADPNPWRDADDEIIAAELVRRIEEKS